MNRFKTKHSYHDADVRSVSFEDSATVAFEISLCGCSDLPGAIVHLAFYSVRNIKAVKEFIDQIQATSSQRDGSLAEVIGFSRDDDRRFVLYLNSGRLYLDAAGFTET